MPTCSKSDGSWTNRCWVGEPVQPIHWKVTVLHYRGKGQDIAISASAQPRRHSASCVQNNRFKTLQPTEFTITELSVFWIYYKRRCCVFRSDGALHQHPPCRPLKKELFHLIQWWETGINLERHFRSPLFLSK